MKADSVVKLSAVAAMWEYIRSINLEHWRYTSLSGPLKTEIDVMMWWEFIYMWQIKFVYLEIIYDIIYK